MSQRRIKWKSVAKDPKTLSTAKLRAIIEHNNDWIQMEASRRYARDGACATWEERQYNELNPYAEELERREIEEEKKS